MKKSKVLVTGGCGYIGSHVCCQLSELGYELVVLDNLSTGHANSLLNEEILVVGNCGDETLLSEIFEKYEIDSVMHFAASIIVPESIDKPIEYYQNNVANTLSLLKISQKFGIKNFIMSSSAAVYGENSNKLSLDEKSATNPIHPYGKSKLMDEWMLEDVANVSSLNYIILRYFNVAGADHKLRIGQKSIQSSHLIKIACEVAVGKRDKLNIFGNDYDTADKTCVRDYVHVEDLAAAHLAALKYLEDSGESTTLNCGYNKGFSVLEVIKALNSMLTKPLVTINAPRRIGDVSYLVAKADRIEKVLNWKPKYKNIEAIVESSLKWEQKLNKQR